MHVDVVDSTNSLTHRLIEEYGYELPDMTLVYANEQTAGRGQVGNSWESDYDLNALFSIYCRPTFIRPSQQFIISQCIALAVQEVVEGEGVQDVSIKWPNDIYVGDRKVAGILIECDIMGKGLNNCIIGVGINVGQRRFRSDAPNPVSIRQITGREHDWQEVMFNVCYTFQRYYQMVRDGKGEQVVNRYMQRLYRREGFHPYIDADGRFMAEIASIEPTGHLVLRREDGTLSRYEFKEVKIDLGLK